MADKDVGPRLGADPELFIQDIATKQIVPICGIVGGTKKNPINLSEQMLKIYGPENIGRRRDIDPRGFYGVQEDNVMLEFNIPAYKELDMFLKAINKAISLIQDVYLTCKGYEYHWGSPDHSFKEDVLDRYEQSKEIGCSPDYFAYAEDNRFKREPLNCAFLGTRRFCGGHIHVQYDTGNVPGHVFAQFMDCVAELPYLSWDKQGGRRLFYGQPGLYRPKDYGIEYRTLSNFWLQPHFRENLLQDLVDNIFQLANKANSNPDHLLDSYRKIPWEDVQLAIRTEDSKMGAELVSYLRAKTALHINGVPERITA